MSKKENDDVADEVWLTELSSEGQTGIEELYWSVQRVQGLAINGAANGPHSAGADDRGCGCGGIGSARRASLVRREGLKGAMCRRAM